MFILRVKAEKKRIAERKDEYAKAQRIKDPAEKEARLAELDRESSSEGAAQLPDPVLYPIDPSTRMQSSVMATNQSSSNDACGKGRGVSLAAADSSRRDGEYLRSVLYDEYEDGFQKAGDKGRDDEGGDDCGCEESDTLCTGIPHFPLIMRVDLQGKFGKEKSVMAFRSKFGSLPARAMLDITEMMYRPHMKKRKEEARKRKRAAAAAAAACSGDDDNGHLMAVDSDLCDEGGSGLLPDDIFLPEPEIIQAYRRLKMFKPDEFTMDGFRKAGCDAHLLNRIMDVVRNTSGKIKRLGFAAEMLPFYARD